MQKVFFPTTFLYIVSSLSASLKWLPSLLYQSKTVFTSNSLLSLSKPFLSVLFQYRPIKSLEVSRWQPPLHTCWISMASMYVSSYIWDAFPQITVELCVILPPALLKTYLWVLKQRVTTVRIWCCSCWPASLHSLCASLSGPFRNTHKYTYLYAYVICTLLTPRGKSSTVAIAVQSSPGWQWKQHIHWSL